MRAVSRAVCALLIVASALVVSPCSADTLAAPLPFSQQVSFLETVPAADSCPNGFEIAESIPYGLNIYTPLYTADAWLALINDANSSVDIAAFYVTLTGAQPGQGGELGQAVYDAIIAAAKRGVRVRLAVTSPSANFKQTDVFNLVKGGYATATFLNFTEIEGVAGVLHTKMIISDNKSFYVGSANMDWRSLTQVKEFGLYFKDCPIAAQDPVKTFSAYWLVGGKEKPPSEWPDALSPTFTMDAPGHITMNGSLTTYFTSVSPKDFRPPGWTHDEDAIVSHFQNAKVVMFEMMDFLPEIIYSSPKRYWSVIDDAIRAAAYINGTEFKILIGYWNNSIPTEFHYLHTLNSVPNIEVKYFLVPPYKVPIDFGRVAHGKWMVTDQALYVGTSNWVGDYFTNTCGVGISISDNENVRSVAQDRFYRDWNSQYAIDLPDSPPH